MAFSYFATTSYLDGIRKLTQGASVLSEAENTNFAFGSAGGVPFYHGYSF